MSRTPLIAANWKMNPIPVGALDHDSPYQTHASVDVWTFPTFLDLPACLEAGILAGGQFGHFEDSGAFTGDISMAMLAKIGCRSALCGHSDRRFFHKETNEEVAEQAIAALEHKMHPVVCIGELLEERKAGKAKEVIEAQLKPLPLESDITLAYEPVWAISRGDPNVPAATTEDAQEMHAFIRSLLPKDRKKDVRILYGGSMKPENAEELLAQPDIDGGLVGGASLVPEKFQAIVDTAAEV